MHLQQCLITSPLPYHFLHNANVSSKELRRSLYSSYMHNISAPLSHMFILMLMHIFNILQIFRHYLIALSWRNLVPICCYNGTNMMRTNMDIYRLFILPNTIIKFIKAYH